MKEVNKEIETNDLLPRICGPFWYENEMYVMMIKNILHFLLDENHAQFLFTIVLSLFNTETIWCR